MESFARRGIRITVAVAGLAALGVGLAAPTAFALPGVPDIGGVGNTQTAPSATDFAKPAGSLGALPDAFRFTPPAGVEQSTRTEAAPSTAAEPADDESTEPETSEVNRTDESDESEATESQDQADDQTETSESTEATPAATPPQTSNGLLPPLPVGAQASPQVAGLNPGSALQGL